MAAEQHAQGYAGDLTAAEAWALLSRDPDAQLIDVRTAAEAWDLLARETDAQLIDVRTAAEWNFVGRPDLASIGRKAHGVEWQIFPGMAQNQDFVAQAAAVLGGRKDAPVLFLCRTGGRSRAAATAMAAAGYTRSYNIAAGFEGDLDPEHHRGQKNGWKAEGLPWRQT